VKQASIKNAVIVGAVRTPIGSYRGSLSLLPATKLGSLVIQDLLNRTSVSKDEVDEVIMGNVLSAGLGQAPARQAALGAGLPLTVGCTTVNKVCGSGLKAVMLASQAIQAGDAEVIVAGGMESMTNAPYLVERRRMSNAFNADQCIDSMIKDGLWDAYNDIHMGTATELCAKKWDVSRAEQDAFAIRSYQRAIAAQQRDDFRNEIVGVSLPEAGHSFEADEEPRKFDPEKLRKLKPAFAPDGTITAGNASATSDGAAAVLVVEEKKASELGLEPMVRITGQATSAREPEWFSVAPVDAIRLLMRKTGRSLRAVDLFEINEAFAASSIAVQRELDLDPETVNIRGGAVALGHPIGASGARLLTTLIHSLRDFDKSVGVASLCIGGGEAVSLMVERV
jgi:acetyl-CoA C-acetyltransferase